MPKKNQNISYRSTDHSHVNSLTIRDSKLPEIENSKQFIPRENLKESKFRSIGLRGSQVVNSIH